MLIEGFGAALSSGLTGIADIVAGDPSDEYTGLPSSGGRAPISTQLDVLPPVARLDANAESWATSSPEPSAYWFRRHAARNRVNMAHRFTMNGCRQQRIAMRRDGT